MNAASTDTITFSKTAKPAILGGVGDVGRACKAASIYGLETDPEVAAKFFEKVMLQSRRVHIASHTSSFKPAKNLNPLKAIAEDSQEFKNAQAIGNSHRWMEVGTTPSRDKSTLA
jgi:hypothetical protein